MIKHFERYHITSDPYILDLLENSIPISIFISLWRRWRRRRWGWPFLLLLHFSFSILSFPRYSKEIYYSNIYLSLNGNKASLRRVAFPFNTHDDILLMIRISGRVKFCGYELLDGKLLLHPFGWCHKILIWISRLNTLNNLHVYFQINS